ncbi:DUF5709 domain-containing protein [Geodermatophilus sp. URMC 63]
MSCSRRTPSRTSTASATCSTRGGPRPSVPGRSPTGGRRSGRSSPARASPGGCPGSFPEREQPDGDGLGDASDTDGELIDREVGWARAGRLLEPPGTWGDAEPELHGRDVGIDSGAASAEEAAVHLVPEDGDDRSSGWTDR